LYYDEAKYVHFDITGSERAEQLLRWRMHNVVAAMTPLPLATLLLAVGTVLSAAELTGENVCHKRET
jgi:hypothetical protein